MKIWREQILNNLETFNRAIQGLEYGYHAAWGETAPADAAVRGELMFNGVTPVAVGRSGIDWTGAHVKHQEWPAQLNRFFMLSPLSAEYRKTGREDYAEAARDYLADWLRAHPTAAWTMAPTDNTLNLSIRVQQWLFTLPSFLKSPAFDETLLESMVRSLEAQQNFLLGHMNANGNWRIAQAESLLVAGLILNFLEPAARWRRVGVDAMNDAFRRQVLPDGAHIERNPGYHQWMNRVFQKLWGLGRAIPSLGVTFTAEGIARMHDYSLAVERPGGGLNGLHDCGWKFGGEESRWAPMRQQFRAAVGLPDVPPETSAFFPHAGQALLRDGWDADATYVTFDATTWGGAHCHLSRNAVQLYAFGEPLIVDPGSLEYEVSNPLMAYGKSTRAHSTITFNGWNQTFMNPIGTVFARVPGYELAYSCYGAGYWPGEYTWWFAQGFGEGLWAAHERLLLWIRGRGVVVLDLAVRANEATGAPAYRRPFLESNWQFSPGPLQVEADRARVIAQREKAGLVMLLPLKPSGMVCEVHEGEMNPCRGWVCGNRAAPQLSLKADPMQNWRADLATVLVPYRGNRPPDVRATVVDPASTNRTGRLDITWADGASDSIFWTAEGNFLNSMLGDRSEFDTDASVAAIGRDAAGKITHGMFHDGTYLRPWSATPLAKPGMARFEVG